MSDWVEQWKVAGQVGDAQRAAEALAEDVVLVSPVTEQFAFRGRDELRELLTSVFEVFTDIRYTDDLRSGTTVALFATGRVGGTVLQEAQRLRLDERGRIRELTLFMRPIPALTAFVRALGPPTARRQGRPGVARVLAVAGAFLDTVATSGDRRFLPLARPESARDAPARAARG